jgi:hypothetical protein
VRPAIPVSLLSAKARPGLEWGFDLSTQHMRNAHFVVIYDRGKVISREEVRFEQDRIRREGCVCVAQSPENEVRLWGGARWEDRVLENVSGRLACVERLTFSLTTLFSPARTRRETSSDERDKQRLS